MSRNKLKGLILVGVTSCIYTIVVVNKIYTIFTYTILLVLMVYTLYISNNKKLVSANFLFVTFFCYMVGVGPLVLLSSGVIYNFNYFTVILGGLLAFCWGDVLASNNREIKTIEDTTRYRFNVQRVHILRAIYITSLVATAYFWFHNRELLISDINGNRIEAQSDSGIIMFTAQLPILIVPMMYDLYYYGRIHGVKTVCRLEMVLLVAVSSVTLMVSGFRSPVLTMYLCLTILYIQRNRVKSKWVILAGLVFVFLTEIMGNLRSTQSGINADNSLTDSFGISLIVNCINLSYVFRAFPSTISFQHGYTYLINLEMLLPGPDLDFTLWLKEQLNLDFSGGGVTPTVLGEFYINFGYPGIYIGMFCLGIVGVYIYSYFKRHSETSLGGVLCMAICMLCKWWNSKCYGLDFVIYNRLLDCNDVPSAE